MSENRIGFLSQLVPPAPSWTVEGVPDQTGKVVIVTGGNRGMGKETARVTILSSIPSRALTDYRHLQVLLSKGAKVYIATRSEERARSSIDELKQDTGRDSIFFLKLDLADLPSVKTAAEEFISKESELHTLYNNA
jgi:NAD(P)-dependent dehydrogenase (short-subunit alcohol dehydrogenase family)